MLAERFAQKENRGVGGRVRPDIRQQVYSLIIMRMV